MHTHIGFFGAQIIARHVKCLCMIEIVQTTNHDKSKSQQSDKKNQCMQKTYLNRFRMDIRKYIVFIYIHSFASFSVTQ